MDGKEIKSLLKQAREAIKEKDFKTALKHCKAVLKIDKTNYNAWVFVGAAAQEIDQFEQSEAAFKRAIEISPDQVLAWQGLCNFYEKHKKEEYVPHLLSAYKKLLDLYDSDKNKKLEIYDKLIPCVQSLHDSEKTVKVLKSKLELLKDDIDQEFEVQKQILQELSGKTNLTNYEKDVLAEALQKMVAHTSFSENDCDRIFSTCIEILQKSDQKYCLSLAALIYEKYPDNAGCVEFLSRTAMNSYIENGSVVENLHEIAEKMKRVEPIGINAIFQGFTAFMAKNYVVAIQLCTKGLKTLECCLQGWYFLSLSQLHLYQYMDSIKSCKSGIDICIKSKAPGILIGKFYLLLGQGLCGRQNYDTAINAIEKSIGYIGWNKETLLVFCSTLLKIGLVEKAEKMYQDHRSKLHEDAEVLQFEGQLYLLKKDFTNALTMLRKSVALAEVPYTLHLIGLVLWESDQRDKAFKVFTKAAELDSYLSQNFLYLGHYYQFELKDKSKACICYQRAFSLDSTDMEIGMSLSQVLKSLNRDDENMKVLQTITENVSLDRCKWAWTQLGLLQLQRNACSEAIHSLQNAVRADPSSSYGWECLADAYLKRGSHESALKAFEKASEINPKSMYPLYQISTIQKMRGFYIEAVEKYKNLLNIVPTYVPALIGLSETLILLAKKCFSDCLYGLSRDYCQEALYTLARVAASNNTLSCLWKLAGDACTIPYHFDDVWFPIFIPHDLHQESNKETISCRKCELLAFGSKFYGFAITKKNISPLWHDLGTNYYFQSKASTSESERLDFSKKAFICFQKAISISPNYELHWTALGVVALGNELKDFAFGQHAFIKSLHINKNNAETWTNLGILYLFHDKIELANLIFRKAQSIEPTYPISWIGQAIIADKVKHVETVDLYRHATTLGSHREANLGYSKVICRTLLDVSDRESEFYKFNIELMNAVVTAADCSVKYVANQTDSPEAFNILGMLLERQKIYTASLRAYKRALDLLEGSSKSDYIEIIRSNYARVLCSAGFMSEAVKQFMLLKTIDVSILCSFALAFYKTKQYEQALKLLKQAFKISKEPGEKSHLLVAMAFVAKNMGSEGPNPLTLLYESSQIKPASVPGLLALCATGILKEDHDLILSTQKQLSPYKYDKKYCTSVAFLQAAQEFTQKGSAAGRSQLLRSVHCLPNNGAMWLQVASCLLQFDKQYAANAAICTKIGSFHGGNKEVASQVFALCQMSIGYKKGALSAAQKAVHINPGNLSNWITLAAACHVAEKDRKDTGWIFSFVKKLAKDQGGIKPHLLGALVILEAFHYIASENMSQAEVLINKALSIPSFNPDTQAALQVLDAVVKMFTNKGNLEPLVLAIKNNPKIFLGWHILSQLLLSSEKFAEAEKTISQFAVTAEKIFPKWTIFPLLQLAVLSYKAMNTKNEDREKWMKLGEEVTGKAVHKLPNCQAARLLQGLFALETGNTNLARRSFEKVLSCSTLKEPKWMEEIASEIIEKKNLKRKEKNQESC